MSSARLAGLISAVVLAVLLAFVVALGVTSRDISVPTNGVTAGGAKDDPGGRAELPALQTRTREQLWPQRQAAGTPTEPPPAAQPEPATRPAPRGGSQLTDSWLANRPTQIGVLRSPEYIRGISSLPRPVTSVLEQPGGRGWRLDRNGVVSLGGAIYILGVAFLLAVFLAWRGRVPVREGLSGETVLRFGLIERANHWMTASSFILMALTGLVILYGETIIRPWLGAAAYSSLAQASAWIHMTFSIAFVIGFVLMAVLWTARNIPDRVDWNWLRQGGGFLPSSRVEPPARKFNAGQKLVFWGVMGGGLLLAITGATLMFPFYWAGYEWMHVAQLTHVVVGLLMVGLILGHIYIGTIGMVGAFQAMWTGRVDRNWAREHHSLWAPEAERQPLQPAERTDAELARSPVAWTSFGAGAVIAIAVAIAMTAVYTTQSQTEVERTHSPYVHVGPQQTKS